MTPEQQREVVRLGFSRKRVIITGLPVDPVFSADYEEGEIFREYGLARTRPVILIMGGSRGWGVKLENVQALLDSDFDLQLVVATGINPVLEQELRKVASRFPAALKVFGEWSNIEVAKLFSIARILVTKPGGLTIAQALLKALPTVLVNPLPGMEEMNLEYLKKRGVGVFAEDGRQLLKWVERLLADKKFYQELRNRSRELSHPEAASLAARAVIDML